MHTFDTGPKLGAMVVLLMRECWFCLAKDGFDESSYSGTTWCLHAGPATVFLLEELQDFLEVPILSSLRVEILSARVD